MLALVSSSLALDCPAGTVSYWQLDEGSGSAAGDSVGSNDGTVYGGAAWVSGKVNSSLSFDGVNDYIDSGDIDALDGLSSLSISLWVKPTSLSTLKSLISKYNSSTGNWIIETSYNGAGGANNLLFAPTAIGGNDYGYTTGNVLNNNVWTHVAMAYDGSGSGNAERLKAYINGEPVSLNFQGNISSSLPSNSLPVLIGAASDGRYFNGIIDEVAVYNRTLTAQEVQDHYNNGLNNRNYCEAPEAPAGGWIRYGDYQFLEKNESNEILTFDEPRIKDINYITNWNTTMRFSDLSLTSNNLTLMPDQTTGTWESYTFNSMNLTDNFERWAVFTVGNSRTPYTASTFYLSYKVNDTDLSDEGWNALSWNDMKAGLGYILLPDSDRKQFLRFKVTMQRADTNTEPVTLSAISQTGDTKKILYLETKNAMGGLYIVTDYANITDTTTKAIRSAITIINNGTRGIRINNLEGSNQGIEMVSYDNFTGQGIRIQNYAPTGMGMQILQYGDNSGLQSLSYGIGSALYGAGYSTGAALKVDGFGSGDLITTNKGFRVDNNGVIYGNGSGLSGIAKTDQANVWTAQQSFDSLIFPNSDIRMKASKAIFLEEGLNNKIGYGNGFLNIYSNETIYLSSSTLDNRNSTNEVTFRVFDNGVAQIPNLANCNTIDTDSAGNLACGADETGTGSGMDYTNIAMTNQSNIFNYDQKIDGNITISQGFHNIKPDEGQGSYRLSLTGVGNIAGALLWVVNETVEKQLVYHPSNEQFEFNDDVFTTGSILVNATNCNSLDTDPNGLIICGADETGTGGGMQYGDYQFAELNKTETQTFAGDLETNGNLNIGSNGTIQKLYIPTHTANSGLIIGDVNSDYLTITHEGSPIETLRWIINGTIDKQLVYNPNSNRFEFNDKVWADEFGISANNGIDFNADGTPAKTLQWNSGNDRFEFNDDVYISAGLLQNATNCNSLDTDANGLIYCGTDETGTGGGIQYGDYQFAELNKTELQTFTGGIRVNDSLNIEGVDYQTLNNGDSKNILGSGTTNGYGGFLTFNAGKYNDGREFTKLTMGNSTDNMMLESTNTNGVVIQLENPTVRTDLHPASLQFDVYNQGKGIYYDITTKHISINSDYLITHGLKMNETNCNSLDTTNDGTIICGTDETGTGSGMQYGDYQFAEKNESNTFFQKNTFNDEVNISKLAIFGGLVTPAQITILDQFFIKAHGHGVQLEWAEDDSKTFGFNIPYNRFELWGGDLYAGGVRDAGGYRNEHSVLINATACNSLDTDSNGLLICGTDEGARIDQANTWAETQTISADKLLKLTVNTTAIPCDETNTGSIMFSSDNRHYGCDGTNWNALY